MESTGVAVPLQGTAPCSVSLKRVCEILFRLQ